MTQTQELNFANRIGYSEISPCEIVRRVNDKTLEVRTMNCAKCSNWEPSFDVGGFLAHCSNQSEQKWVITSNPNGLVLRIRLQKDGTWRDSYGDRYALNAKPIRFYDYNF